MYGKIFESMYDGTMFGHWKGIVTLQQLLVICDSDGIVDMTPPAISAKTSIPLDIIEEGLAFLQETDKYSRSPEEDGVRIKLIDPDRPWGWYIVNHKRYQKIVRREDKKKADRDRIAAKRSEKSKNSNEINDVAESRVVSESVLDVAHEDVDVNEDIDSTSKDLTAPSAKKQPVNNLDHTDDGITLIHSTIIDYYHYYCPTLPRVLKKRWKNSVREKHLNARMKEMGKDGDLQLFWIEFFTAIAKHEFWLGDNNRGWKADLGWLVKRANFDKALEFKENLDNGIISGRNENEKDRRSNTPSTRQRKENQQRAYEAITARESSEGSDSS